MYERFTDRARKVMKLANDEAIALGHDFVDTEHILLGLIQEGYGVAANVLKNLDIDLEKIRLEVERLVPRGPDRVMRGTLPHSPTAKKALDFSMEEARNLTHNYVGTEHLLLGLLREQEGVAVQVLNRFGLQPDVVRNEVLDLLGHGSETTDNKAQRGTEQRRTVPPDGISHDTKTGRSMYDRFTDRARKVMQLANQEAQRFNHKYIGTEHVLFGLVKEGSGVAAEVLKSLGVDLHKIRYELEKLVQGKSDMVTLDKLPQTPQAKKLIEYAMEEARNLNHDYVGTEHILLGLLRDEDGTGAQVLMNQGLQLVEVRAEVLAVLSMLNADVHNSKWIERGVQQRGTAQTDSISQDTKTGRGTHNTCTDRARRVMQLANQEARRFNHEYIGTEHLLLGLVREGSGVAAEVVKNLGVDLHKIRFEVEKLIRSGPGMVTLGRLPQTLRAKKVIEYALEQARDWKHDCLGTEHILVGLLREAEGVAAQVLFNLGLTLDEVRATVLNVLAADVPNTKWTQRGAGPLPGQNVERKQRPPSSPLQGIFQAARRRKAVRGRHPSSRFEAKDAVLGLAWFFLALGIVGLLLGVAGDAHLTLPGAILIGASLIALALGRR